MCQLGTEVYFYSTGVPHHKFQVNKKYAPQMRLFEMHKKNTGDLSSQVDTIWKQGFSLGTPVSPIHNILATIV